MAYVDEEIASQPDCWRRAIDLAGTPAVRDALPQPGERVAVIGCGTSLYMSQAYAGLREAAGQGETDAFAASEFPAGRKYDRVVALSRSGTTSETLAALAAVADGVLTTALTADGSTPLAAAAGHSIAVEFANEKAVVQTRYATSALVLLRAHLGEDVSHLPGQAEWALAEPLPDGALDRRQYVFLARGWAIGVANESGLKMREAAQTWAESYPAMEYRHGPMSVADERTLAWIYGTPPENLVADIEGTGAAVANADVDPVADLIRVQRTAATLAVQLGLDPDKPRGLDFSVVLSGAAR